MNHVFNITKSCILYVFSGLKSRKVLSLKNLEKILNFIPGKVYEPCKYAYNYLYNYIHLNDFYRNHMMLFFNLLGFAFAHSLPILYNICLS